ncbi:MAG: ferritin family protein [Candidatus Omnitrophica bacterium]|jgi:Uncharacterized conserved protein|nr:ferritin family protein [Candidatus Omnitrophota bacterium]
MKEALNVREILEIAVHVEENGESLYARLEKKARQEPLRLMWCDLKEQEKNHRVVFQTMIDDLQEDGAYEFSAGEYSDYFKAVSGNYIITQKLIEQKKTELFASDREALDFGVAVEEESILVYSALQEYLSSKQKKIISRVIDEEKRHLVRLTQARENLRKGG